MDETNCEQRMEDNNSVLLLLKQCLVLLEKYNEYLNVMSNVCKCEENIENKILFYDLISKYKTIINNNKILIESLNTSQFSNKFLHLFESNLSEDNNKDNETVINECIIEQNIKENESINCSENNGNNDLIGDNVTRNNQIINEQNIENIEKNVNTINENINESFEYISNNYLVINKIDSIIENNQKLLNSNDKITTRGAKATKNKRTINKSHKTFLKSPKIDSNILIPQSIQPIIILNNANNNLSNNSSNNNPKKFEANNTRVFVSQTTKCNFEVNEPKSKSKCYICEKEFNNTFDLKAHNKEHHSKRPLICEKIYFGKVCGKVFSRYSNLNEHIKTVHLNSKSKPIHRKLPIIRDESGKLFKCPECGKQYEIISRLHNHRSHVHSQHRYECDWKDCNFSSPTERRLEVHRNRHLNIKPIRCSWPGCDSTFVAKGDLDMHTIRHSDYQFHCPHCNRAFKSNYYLKQHIMGVHSSDTPFECDRCHKRYATKIQLGRHLRKIHLAKKFQCDKCEYIDTKPLLIRHNKRVHLRERTYICEVKGCEAKFFDKKGLLAHQMSVHSDERQFVCDWPECGAAFKLKNNLTMHIKCHTGENKPRKRKKS